MNSESIIFVALIVCVFIYAFVRGSLRNNGDRANEIRDNIDESREINKKTGDIVKELESENRTARELNSSIRQDNQSARDIIEAIRNKKYSRKDS